MSQIKSRERVRERAEVFTHDREVNAMLDLIDSADEGVTHRVRTTFLEPTCGNGNFLTVILQRKLTHIRATAKSPKATEIYTLLALSSIYGVDIAEDNVLECRERLTQDIRTHMPELDSKPFWRSIDYILRKNIICGDMLNHANKVLFTKFDLVKQDKGPPLFTQEACPLPSILARSTANPIRAKNLFNLTREPIKTAPHPHLALHDHELGPTVPTKSPTSLRFDVVIGNPPYQITYGSGGNKANAKSIYHLFVNQARELNPRYLSFIIPARWYATGKGLDDFRISMLSDRRISHLIDFPNSALCFPEVNIEGGVCYFLWDASHDGLCQVQTVRAEGKISKPQLRKLNRFDVFMRNPRQAHIVSKIKAQFKRSMASECSVSAPFGVHTNFTDFSAEPSATNTVLLYARQRTGWISPRHIIANKKLVPKYKVIISKAYGGHEQVLGRPIVAPPNSCCTATYIVLGAFDNEQEAKHLAAYVRTKFFRFLVSSRKITQNSARSTFAFTPHLPMNTDKPWRDETLYQLFNLDERDIAYIESRVRAIKPKKKL